MKTYKNTLCINCRSNTLKRFIDLGNQPNGNHFPDQMSKHDEIFFPFAMSVCDECWQVQLEEFPPPEFMFAEHPYITGLNVPVVKHFQTLGVHIVEKFKVKKSSLVIDIGCNDGTFLSVFEDLGLRVLGVDPGQVTGDLCRARGINVCQSFWSKTTGRALKDLNLMPSIITATAVFYHIPDLHDFVEGLREVMDEETVFVTQCVYLKDVIEKNQFDHFYHEHTMIHSLLPLKRLFESHGMRIFDVEFDPIHGGSFILYVGLSSCVYSNTKRLADALVIEENAYLNQLTTYQLFATRVEKNRDDLIKLLKKIKKQGGKIYGLCAPVKGNTLLNYANIGPGLVEKITEINPHKIGKLTPGTHIPIIDEKLLDVQPDYYLILSWNFLDFFIDKYSDYLRSGGKFIVTNPKVKVLDSDDLLVQL